MVFSFRPQNGASTHQRLVDVLRRSRDQPLENSQEGMTWSGNKQVSAFFLNSFVITLPAVLIPIRLGHVCCLWVCVDQVQRAGLSLLGVCAADRADPGGPVPLLTSSSTPGWSCFFPVWFSTPLFALPLGIFLLHNFMSEMPGSICRGGAGRRLGHVRIFRVVLLPPMVPALAASGSSSSSGSGTICWSPWSSRPLPNAPADCLLAGLAGTRGNVCGSVLSAGAFIAIIRAAHRVLRLQRSFVRGLLAGA